LRRLTGSTVWVDMKRNYYNKQHEYPDPSKEYGQSAVEDVKLLGHCIKQIIYKEGLGNHLILENEAFDTSKNDQVLEMENAWSIANTNLMAILSALTCGLISTRSDSFDHSFFPLTHIHNQL
jgi:hypothetical protein